MAFNFDYYNNAPPPNTTPYMDSDVPENNENRNVSDAYVYDAQTPATQIQNQAPETINTSSSRIKRSEIERAVHKLIAHGENVSINRVREMVGHGSYSTISRMLKDLGIGSERLLKNSNNVSDKVSSEQQNLLQGLDNECLKLRSRCETLDHSIKHTNDEITKQVAKLTTLEVLKDIVLRHCRNDSVIRELLKNAGINTIIDEAAMQATAPIIRALKDTTLCNIIRSLDGELANGAPEYAGGINSIKAIIAMLEDERNKNRMDSNEQAYHF